MSLFAALFGRAEPVLGPAQTRDARALAAIHTDSFNRGWGEQEFDQLLTDRTVIADRAASGAKIVGFIVSRRAADEAEILSVATARNWRGRGLAQRLLDLHLRRLAGFGLRAVFLEVEENNMPARKLYARAGFIEVGRRPGYYAQGRDKPASALVLRRDLV
jgi:[ribosomal protein S18]-alanine N-acetyltransferase